MKGPLRAGEACLLIDTQGRRYLVQLSEEGELHSHLGVLAHKEVIGQTEGSRLATSKGHRLLALRPGISDFILKMKRGPQVVYPKDIGAIIVHADIAPNVTVVEGGTGSGALTIALVRAVAEGGRVISVDRRADHTEVARGTVESFFGEIPANLDLRVDRVEEVVAELSTDRVVLDIPEPWHVVEPASLRLTPGGFFCAYVPTVPQMELLVRELRANQGFDQVSSFEVLWRAWNVEGRSVRPSHQMVGHTGFITVARKVS